MIDKRVLLFLPLAFVGGACADDAVQPTQPEIAASMVGGGISDEASLQAALDAASTASRRSTIRLEKGVVIALSGTLTHTGSAPLRIDGRGATLLGPEEGNAVDFTGGGSLSINHLTVEGAGEHGLYAEVPGERSGTFSVAMRQVTLRDNGFAGLWIDDQVYDSPASVSVRIIRSEISGNNTAGVGDAGLTYEEVLTLADKDGVRVNEGGQGDLRIWIQHSNFFENQADGFEADETGNGDVHSMVLNSHFDDNGDQLVFPDEAPPGFPGDPSDYEKDLEDGFDIDENDEGSVRATFFNVTAHSNEDEGIDLDETFNGSISMSGNRIVANDNFGAGIQLTESKDQPDTDGDIVVSLFNVTTNDSRDSRGIRLEEFQAGDVLGRIVRATFDGNDSDGLRVEEYEDGAVDLKIWSAAFTNNGGDGLQAEENGTITLVKPTFEGNGDDDINVDDDGVAVTVVGG